MFPWTDGFHWTATHIIFLSLFFLALAIIGSTVASAIGRSLSDFRQHRAAAICWRDNFSELPESARRCRHQLAGRVESRICDNAFDCRTCPIYVNFASLPAHTPDKNVGVCYSDNMLYHRGHTWVRHDWDGTYAVGLDEFALHLIGRPDSVRLPAPFEELESDGIAWTMTKNGYQIRVRAPLSGTVVATGGPEKGWYVKILPHGEPNLRHLLSGPEMTGWLASEVDRLHIQLSSTKDGSPCLADGGMLMPDLMDAEPKANWDPVLASTFLDS
jgi:hypothetical protein